MIYRADKDNKYEIRVDGRLMWDVYEVDTTAGVIRYYRNQYNDPFAAIDDPRGAPEPQLTPSGKRLQRRTLRVASHRIKVTRMRETDPRDRRE